MSSKPVSVTFIIAALVIGGAERQLLYLLKGLDRKRYQPRLVAFQDGPWRNKFEELDVPLTIIPYKQGRWRVLTRLASLLRQEHPELVHTFGHSANLIGRMAAFMARVPAVIVSERSAPFIKSRSTRLIDRFLAPFTRGMIANSDHAVRYWIKHGLIAKDNAWAVHNGIDISRFPVSSGSIDGLQLVTAGDMRKVKNHALLLEALHLVVKKQPDVRLTIAGDGPLRCEIKEQTDRLGIKNNVKLPGFVKDIPGLYGTSDIYVHTSFYEGMPNAVMEAMACGLPCVVTSSDGCRELITDGIHGLVVDTDNADALAKAILKLVTNKKISNSMGKAGTERIEKEYSIAQMIKSTEGIYRDILSVTGMTGI